MTLDPRTYFNALASVPGCDYRKLAALLRTHGSWEAAWRATKPSSEAQTRASYDALPAAGISLILPGDANFPPLLREMPWPPLALYVRGAALDFSKPSIAIVGTRRASEAGLDLARRFASTLASRGVTVVSGLALGIDAAAHTGALEAGGTTVAVLASGADSITPHQNARLGREILKQNGSIVSEYPMGMPALPHQFIERNRIVSGLSLGVIVIEAPEKSGALATARFALDQNREVFVVPGPAASPLYVGSHALIKSGAALITDIDDVLASLNLETSSSPETISTPANLDSHEQAVFNSLRTAGTILAPDTLAISCSLPIEEVNQTLSFLVVRGIVCETGSGYKVA